VWREPIGERTVPCGKGAAPAVLEMRSRAHITVPLPRVLRQEKRPPLGRA